MKALLKWLPPPPSSSGGLAGGAAADSFKASKAQASLSRGPFTADAIVFESVSVFNPSPVCHENNSDFVVVVEILQQNRKK